MVASSSSKGRVSSVAKNAPSKGRASSVAKNAPSKGRVSSVAKNAPSKGRASSVAKSASSKARTASVAKNAPSKARTASVAVKRASGGTKARADASSAERRFRAYVVKSEPFVYSFDQLVADGKTSWDGVRNFEARNTLRAMKKGDTLLYYHSNEGKEIVGIARVTREAYQDPTTSDDFSSVEVAPVKKLARAVTLAELKAHPILSGMALVRRSRISVTPVTDEELTAVLTLARTKL